MINIRLLIIVKMNIFFDFFDTLRRFLMEKYINIS